MIALLPVLASAYQWNHELKEIPQFILDHAPILHLYSEEKFLPGSIDEYVTNFLMSNSTTNSTTKLNISNLNSVSKTLLGETYLTAKEQWDSNPDWLVGTKPKLLSGYANASATLIVVDKPNINAIDAFWFYFYPFNLGPFVMGHGPFGNHLGDWEHSLVRFNRKTKEPELVWMSAHGGGTAYKYDALLSENVRNGTRPVLFSARGTHAQYTSSGRHPHDIPWHMLSDFTDPGDVWDPALNHLAYVLNGVDLHPANGTLKNRELEFGDWLLFDGHWGNKQLDKTDVRQQWSPFEFRIIDGPLGPLFKNLQRTSPCERSKWWNLAKSCRVRNSKTPGEGIDSTDSHCSLLIQRLPAFLQPIFGIITYNGYLCFWYDRLFA